jgi:L-ascorbate metabolism protein UlaG (beta-lactamase superfamily)
VARIVVLVLALLLPRLAEAGCAPVAAAEPRLWRVSTGDALVTITFLGHASFEIESPSGIRAVTDYNGYNLPAGPPHIATMNNAHSTHYTMTPDPRIAHVLHGWRKQGVKPNHDLRLRDLRVTNLSTNIRDTGTATDGNSIFVFETAGLCIAHLGHLHHLLEPGDIDALGRIDVLMVPIDGIWTMSQRDAATVVAQLHPRVVLPMHYFTRDVLARFLDLLRDSHAIDIRTDPVLTMSRAGLPDRPTVIALPGGY